MEFFNQTTPPLMIDLSQPAGVWEKMDAGWVQSNAKVGSISFSQPTGSLLIDNSNAINDTMKMLTLDVSLSSQYVSGLVFNYIDKDNFTVFLVNHLATSTNYHRIIIGRYVKNKYSEFYNEKFDGMLPKKSLFTIQQQDNGLLFKINNQEIYTDKSLNFLSGSYAGLYSQCNDDTIFHALSFEMTADNITSASSTDAQIAENTAQLIESEPRTQAEEELERYVFRDNHNENIQPYLKIKEPFSKSEVTFQEVFAVHMDDFYEDIFFNPAYNGSLKDYFNTLALAGDDQPANVETLNEFTTAKLKIPSLTHISNDGKIVYVADYNGMLSKWDIKEKLPKKVKNIAATNGNRAIRSIDVFYDSTDTKPVNIITAGDDGYIRIWDANTFTKKLEIRVNDDVHNVCFSPDGTEFLAAQRGASLYDTKNGQIIRSFSNNNQLCYCAEFSNNGAQIIIGGGKDLYLFNKDSDGNQEIKKFTGHARDVLCVKFSSKNNTFISGGCDGRVIVWNMDGAVSTLFGHQDWVKDVQFMLDEGAIISASTGGEVKIWSLRNEQVLFDFPEFKSGILQVSFSEQTNRLVLSTSHSKAYIYHISQTQRVAQTSEEDRSLVPSQKTSFSVLLDTRPKLWYRQYQLCTNYEDELSKKIAYYDGLLKAAKLSEEVSEEVSEKELHDINDMHDIYRELLQERYHIRDQKSAILQNVRLNGYHLTDEKDVVVDETLQNLGYDFAITKGEPQLLPFEAYSIDLKQEKRPDGWYSPILEEDVEWASQVKTFSDSLFDDKILNVLKKAALKNQMAELMSFNSCLPLKAEIQKLDTKINQLEKTIGDRKKEMESKQKAIEADIIEWDKDIEDLQDRMKLLGNARNNHFNKASGGKSIIEVFYQKPYKKLKLELKSARLTAETSIAKKYRRNCSTVTIRRIIDVGLDGYLIDISNYHSLHFRQRYHRILGRYWEDDYAFGIVPSANKTFYANDKSHHVFVKNAINFCRASIAELKDRLTQIPKGMGKSELELRNAKSSRDILMKHGLKNRRLAFLQYWNDPSQFENFELIDNAVMPDNDPLADLIENLKKGHFDINPVNKDNIQQYKVKTEWFRFSNGRFASNNGLTPRTYLNNLRLNTEENMLDVALFPIIEASGKAAEHVMRAVINPQPARKVARIPSIRFVETYTVDFVWQGYRLGELAHVETLFPGEKKTMEIEVSTKISREEIIEQTVSNSKATKQSSSLEEKVENEFSDKLLKSDEFSKKRELAEAAKRTDTSNQSQTDTTSFGVNASAEATSDTRFKTSVASGSSNVKYGVNSQFQKDRSRTDSSGKTRAFESSRNDNVQSANKENRESFAKNLVNTLKNSAAETSSENKVEIKTNSTEKLEDTSTRKEMITIENPNIGRTINYNFFQVQNTYETVTRLVDIKVVIDTNSQVIHNSETTDIQIFEIEEIGKIFKTLEDSNEMGTLLSAVVMRQIFKNYLVTSSGIGEGNGALMIDEGFEIDEDMLDMLNITSAKLLDSPNLTDALQEALEYAKKIPFRFQELDVHSTEPLAVNAGTFYLDAEVGQIPATEEYLEKRRYVELGMEQAKLEHMRKQTEAGVFHPEIPETLSQLSFGDAYPNSDNKS